MKEDADGKPVVEASNKGLGVRVSPASNIPDVDLDQDGKVILNNKGMSVAPAWRDLPYFLVPMKLRDKFPAARGNTPGLRVFTMGSGRFEDGPVAVGLDLKQDAPKHGVVVPRESVLIDQFQANLAATRDHWTIEED